FEVQARIGSSERGRLVDSRGVLLRPQVVLVEARAAGPRLEQEVSIQVGVRVADRHPNDGFRRDAGNMDDGRVADADESTPESPLAWALGIETRQRNPGELSPTPGAPAPIRDA